MSSRRRSSAATTRPRSDSTFSRAFDGVDVSPNGTSAVKPLGEETFVEEYEDDDDDDDDDDEVLPLHSNTFVDLHVVGGGSKESGIRAYLHPTILQLYDHNYGLFLIAMAQFFFASMSTSVKFLMETTEMSTLTLIFVRMGITLIFCWIVLFIRRDPHPILGPPEVRKILVLRGMAGFGGLVCAYQALRALSVSDAVTIGFLTPSFTALFGYLLLGESFGLKEAVSGFASLLGVILISRPPFIFGHGWDTKHMNDNAGKGRLNIDLPTDDSESSSRLVAVTWALGGVFFSATACELTMQMTTDQQTCPFATLASGPMPSIRSATSLWRVPSPAACKLISSWPSTMSTSSASCLHVQCDAPNPGQPKVA